MKVYKTKARKIPGHRYGDVMISAFAVFDEIKKIQIKEDRRRRKYFMSCFPRE